MNVQLMSLLITIGLLVLVLLFLAWRLLRVTARSARGGDEAPRGDLLFDTLRRQTEGRRAADRGKVLAQQALSTMEDMHRTVMTHLPIGVLVVDRAGEVRFSNPRAREILPPPADAAVLAGWCPPLAEAFEALRVSGARGPEAFSPDGADRERVAELTCDPLDDAFLLTLVDVTRLMRLQEQVRTKRDLELMGEMASGITHEVKNALATISGHVQMLSFGDVGTHAGHIMTEVDHLLAFVRRFMLVGKGESWAPQEMALAPWFDEIARHWAARSEGRTVTVTPPPDGLVLWGERTLLTTVVHNLILNAVQAGGEAGAPAVHLTAEAGADGVRVVVADDGPGFPPQVRARMFSPFVSSKAGGSGLGLFQCRKIMMEHQGRLEVDHGPPTRVICHFPKEIVTPAAGAC